MNHSSFLSGAPVLSAGELMIEHGMITTITDKSGHYTPMINDEYQPSQEMLVKGLKALKQQGVDLSKVNLVPHSLNQNSKQVNALKFLLETQQKELENDPNNQGNVNREEAEKMLAQAHDKTWLLRYSPSQEQYVMSMRYAPNDYKHVFMADFSLNELQQIVSQFYMLTKK